MEGTGHMRTGRHFKLTYVMQWTNSTEAVHFNYSSGRNFTIVDEPCNHSKITPTFFFFFFLVFLGLHPQHMGILRLGVKSEL